MPKIVMLVALVFCVPLCLYAAPAMQFTDVTDSAAVGDTAHAYGTCLGDYNNDGEVDIFVANIFLPSILFRNEGELYFSNVTDSAGIHGLVQAHSASMADYDNDGDLDLVLGETGRDQLYRNNGDGTFTDFTDSAGIAVGDTLSGMDAVWADYDNDGYADLLIVNGGGGSILYHNEGDGTFTDATSASGIDCFSGLSGVWFDYDNDADADLFIAAFSGYADQLYRNNGNSTFTEVGDSAGLASIDSSFGCVAGDVDGDGNIDLFVSGFAGLSILYHNNGDGTFSDVTDSSGIYVPSMGTGCALEDFDSDGDLDLYVGNFDFKNHMFENDGTGEFTDVATQSGVADSGFERTGVGITAGDLDGDGDVDIYCGNHKRNTLFRNDTETSLLVPYNSLVVDLEGTASNRSALGARVYLSTPAGTQVREVTGGSGAMSMSSLALEFGLGSYASADIMIRWPSGLVEGGSLPSGSYHIVEGMFPGVAEQANRAAGRIAVLRQNGPNPFRHATSISYSLPAAAHVTLAIHDVAGRLVETLVNETQQPGTHQISWNRAENPSGVYFYRLRACPERSPELAEGRSRRAGEFKETRKMVVIE